MNIPIDIRLKYKNLTAEAAYAIHMDDLDRAQQLHAEAGVLLLNERRLRDQGTQDGAA